jgi:integrase
MASKKRPGRPRQTRRSWGTIRPLESGRWQAGYKPHKGAKYKWAPMTFRLYGEADEWLTKTRADLARGEWVDPNLALIEFETYALEWVRTRVTRAGGPLKAGTVDRYLRLLDNYICPEIGSIALGHLTGAEIRAWRATLAHIPATQAGAYKLVRAILTTAVNDGRIKKNPATIDGGGRYKARERVPAVETAILAATALMPERERLWVLLACWAGMRRGELLNLRRWQINVEMQTIFIGPTRVAVGGKFVDQEDGKTVLSTRFVVVPKLVMDFVVLHLAAFVDDDADARVFTGVRDRSKPVCVRTLYNHWHAARAKIERPRGAGPLTMHDLRHSGNTIQSSHGGATTKERMDFFGWAREEMAHHYDHTVDGRQVEIAARLNDRLADSNVVSLFPRGSHGDRTADAGGA